MVEMAVVLYSAPARPRTVPLCRKSDPRGCERRCSGPARRSPPRCRRDDQGDEGGCQPVGGYGSVRGMLASARVVAFVPSTDLGRSRSFYESVLGLPVVSADGFAVVVDGPGGHIRITHVGSALRTQQFTILGWEVPDIAAEVDALAARGVEF